MTEWWTVPFAPVSGDFLHCSFALMRDFNARAQRVLSITHDMDHCVMDINIEDVGSAGVLII